MNHLAHIYLSCQDGDLLTGNFMADFITTKDIKSLPPYLKQGIELHKSIDHFTDHHPEVKKCILLLRPTQGKYTPVVVDILLDYFLIKNWNLFSGESFEIFKNKVYDHLLSVSDSFPEKLKMSLPKMINNDFLMSCHNEERLNKTFDHLSKRVHFPHNFGSVTADLKANSEALESHFLSFFPDLISHVQPFCNCK